MFFFPADEIKRKRFHLLTLLYIAAYWMLPLPVVLGGLGTLIMIVLIGELVRLRVPSFNEWILAALGGVHRAEETQKISGLLWTLSGSLLTMAIYPDRVAVLASLLYLAFGDAGAALFGKRFGKHKLFWGKSLEGSLACFLICLCVGLFLFSFPLALAGALVATLIELIPWPLNDNFWMPLLTTGSLMALKLFL